MSSSSSSSANQCPLKKYVFFFRFFNDHFVKKPSCSNSTVIMTFDKESVDCSDIRWITGYQFWSLWVFQDQQIELKHRFLCLFQIYHQSLFFQNLHLHHTDKTLTLAPESIVNNSNENNHNLIWQERIKLIVWIEFVWLLVPAPLLSPVVIVNL